MARAFAAASSQYLIHSAAVLTAEPLTMACWFKSNDVTGNYSLMSLGTNGALERWVLTAAGGVGGDPIRATSVNAGGGANLACDTTAGYTAGAWHHATGVFTSSTSRAAYLNGGNKGTDATSVAMTGVVDRTLVAARINTTIGAFLDGAVAEAGIWSAALTDSEVASLAKGFSPLLVRPASLVAYWPLIGRTDPEISLKGGLNLTLSGGPTNADHCPVIMPRKRAA
jgi:hypothetical protein